VNVDAEENCKADVTWDLNKTPMPFKDEEFDIIIANHIFEHVDKWWDCFRDCSRILKVGGRFEIWLPGNGSDSQLGYRDHVSMINQCSFAGISGFYRNFGNAWELDQYSNEINRMKMVKQYANMCKYWWLEIMPDRFKKFCMEHLRNVVYEIGFVLTKLPEKDLGLKKES
jgi:SAM-dependent methyltransferase